ncbi:MAG: exodeoxyribonuclease VII small subunit [Oscillospiraceae bacterium]|jgi:exodeoxyribonuclease VII small subunit|nr:exodeoxyribonuclease VII small subunit [Oscillospiraceae bacterium]
MSNESKTFEASVTRLEQIVRLLEQGDAPLEDAMKLFEEGTSLIASCNEMLTKAEQQVVKLSKGPDGTPVEEAFEDEE